MSAGDLRAAIAAAARPATLVEPAPEVGPGASRCLACGHRCVLGESDIGRCRVRWVEGGRLLAPWGQVAAVTADPIEKKPFYHVLPGTTTLTFGMLGCDMRCPFCQNWFVSQALRDPQAGVEPQAATPEELVAAAQEEGAASITSSFNEPLISGEWVAAVFAAARAAGLATGLVSNGHGTPEAVAALAPVLDFAKVDLKAFREATYRSLGGGLADVKATLEGFLAAGVFVEVVTVLIPGQNDSEEEVGAMAAYLAGLDPALPWHLHGFRPDYKLTTVEATPAATLLRARAQAEAAGLRHVYCGLAAGLPPGQEDTRCAGCGEVLVRRRGFRVTGGAGAARRSDPGRDACPGCGAGLPIRFPGAGGGPGG